ncbi:phosphopentomutase [Fangia hongkongensis]|uniref:phosphopentomutase n=1 Tax=Fangia hongkongensis TaxID=270495 RepID=UPI000381D8A5|nr:phosphopentomutase [Fangia hongkongensis]MBK2123978.1 phosphopentomutase [Fangia hongkongensis]
MLKNKKVIILLMDSFGIGESKDAVRFGDEGGDTLGHIVDYRAPCNPLRLPNLAKRGLEEAAQMSRARPLSVSLSEEENTQVQNSKFGYCIEQSLGKDTPSGHWEIAGVPVLFDWHYFERKETGSVFPQAFLDEWVKRTNLTEGFLDAGHGSGTEVLKSLGVEHCITKKPIIYTSADSVFQIAAHEEYFGLERLYELCEVARKLFDEMGLVVGRVIARPFVGESAVDYQRTGNRKDYSILPPEKTLLDVLKSAGAEVVSVGKIADIYAHQGITKKLKATGIDALFDATVQAYKEANNNTLIFTNFVDFDSSFGHRRDVKGYANALELFDARLPELDALLDDDTIVIVAADHGCDPTAEGSDHTREHIPFLLWGNRVKTENIGARQSFADIGQSIADYMGVTALAYGDSVFKKESLACHT